MLDSTGALVVEYRYDAWGKPISTAGSLKDTLGKLNPFRYRGMYSTRSPRSNCLALWEGCNMKRKIKWFRAFIIITVFVLTLFTVAIIIQLFFPGLINRSEQNFGENLGLEGYVYWCGYNSREIRFKERMPRLYGWDLATGKHVDLGFHGYVLQGERNDARVRAVLLDDQEEDYITILRLENGKASIETKIARPEHCIWPIYISDTWIYYTFIESDHCRGIRRINAAGEFDTYDLTEYISKERFSSFPPLKSQYDTLDFDYPLDMIGRVSDEGWIVFAPGDPERAFDLLLIDTSGHVELIDHWVCCYWWISGHELIYRKNMYETKQIKEKEYEIINQPELRSLNLASSENQFLSFYKNTGLRQNPTMLSVYSDPSGEWLVWQETDSSWEADTEHPLMIQNIKTKEYALSPDATMCMIGDTGRVVALRFGE